MINQTLSDLIENTEDSKFKTVKIRVLLNELKKAKIVQNKEWLKPLKEESKLDKYQTVSFYIKEFEMWNDYPDPSVGDWEEIESKYKLTMLYKVVYKESEKIYNAKIWKAFVDAYKSKEHDYLVMEGMLEIGKKEIRILMIEK